MRVLLVDTGRAAYPLYKALKSRGYEVWVVGDNLDDPLVNLADHYKKLDYSDVKALSDFVCNLGFDFIVPGCNDLSYKVCSKIAGNRYLALDSPEITSLINEKNLFRAAAVAANIPVPEVYSQNQAIGRDSVIVKPVDSFSGRGVSVLKQPGREELLCAAERARCVSAKGDVVLEEFVSGQLYSVSAFLCAGKTVASFFVREDCVINPFAVDTSKVDLAFPEYLKDQLLRDIERFARHIGVCGGLVHAQFILGEEQYWFIEMTRRCPGDLYSTLIELSTGYPYAESYVASFIGADPVPLVQSMPHRFIIRRTVVATDHDFFWSLSFGKPSQIELIVPLLAAGNNTSRGQDRVALVFFVSPTEDEDRSLYQKLLLNNVYSIEGKLLHL